MWECPDVLQMALAQFANAQCQLQLLILTNAHWQLTLLHNSEEVREVCNLHIYNFLNAYLKVHH